MKLLIFDVDGVLEKEEVIAKARRQKQLEKVAEKLDVSVSEAGKKYVEARKKLPPEKRTTSAYVFMTFGFTREEYFAALDEVDPSGLITAHDNCVEMLEKVKEGNVLVTLSNTPRKSSVKTLEVLGISQYFEKNYSTEDFEESKPSLNILKKIMSDFSVDAKDTVSIGNSIEKDIMPAHSLGIKTILFDPEGKYGEAKEADHVIKDLIEVVELIR